MGNKIYSLILCILFLSCLAASAKAQDTAITGLSVCPANYRTQQDSGAAPYFVYDYAAFSPQKGASYRFIPFPSDYYKNTFLWDFGDHSPRDTNYTAFHYYPDTGAYSVTLTILHHSGTEKCVSRVSRLVRILPEDSLATAVEVVQDLIYNSMGNQVYHNTISGTAGNNWISIPVANLPKGVYYIRFIYGNDTRRSRFLKG